MEGAKSNGADDVPWLADIKAALNKAVNDPDEGKWRKACEEFEEYIFDMSYTVFRIERPGLPEECTVLLADCATAEALDRAVENINRTGEGSGGQLVDLAWEALFGRDLGNGYRTRGIIGKLLLETQKLQSDTQKLQNLIIQTLSIEEQETELEVEEPPETSLSPDEFTLRKIALGNFLLLLDEVKEKIPQKAEVKRKVLETLISIFTRFSQNFYPGISWIEPISLYHLEGKKITLNKDISETIQLKANLSQGAARKQVDHLRLLLQDIVNQCGNDLDGVFKIIEDQKPQTRH